MAFMFTFDCTSAPALTANMAASMRDDRRIDADGRRELDLPSTGIATSAPLDNEYERDSARPPIIGGSLGGASAEAPSRLCCRAMMLKF